MMLFNFLYLSIHITVFLIMAYRWLLSLFSFFLTINILVQETLFIFPFASPTNSSQGEIKGGGYALFNNIFVRISWNNVRRKTNFCNSSGRGLRPESEEPGWWSKHPASISVVTAWVGPWREHGPWPWPWPQGTQALEGKTDTNN